MFSHILTPTPRLFKFYRFINQRGLLLLVLVLLANPLAAQNDSNIQMLEPGKPVERTLEGGQFRSYFILIAAGQYLYLVTDQRGIDVEVTLFGPDGEQVIKVDSPNGTQGPEPLLIIAERAGTYRLEVRSLEKNVHAGRYQVKIEELRTAIAQDESRISAQRVVTGAELLNEEGTEESRRSAIKRYEEALSLYRAIDDQGNTARTLNKIGEVYSLLADFQKAVEYYEEALLLYQHIKDSFNQAITLHNIGQTYDKLGDSGKTLDYYERALQIFRTLDGRHDEVAVVLYRIGRTYHALGDKLHDRGNTLKARSYYLQALPEFQAARNRNGEGRALNDIGRTYLDLDERQKALDYYLPALSIFRDLKDNNHVATMLINVGDAYNVLDEKQTAMGYYLEALPLIQTRGDLGREVDLLNSIGVAYESLGEPQNALDYCERAELIVRRLKDRPREAETLNNFGVIYDNLGDKPKALAYYTQVLTIFRDLSGHDYEVAVALNNIGRTYKDLGEAKKALDSYTQALSTVRALKKHDVVGIVLTNIGEAYFALGEKQKALDYFSEALPIRQAIPDRSGEATTRNDIGLVYESWGNKQEALKYFTQAESIYHEIQDRVGKAQVFNNLGLLYRHSGEGQKALKYYMEALPLFRAVGSRRGEAITLSNIGFAYDDLGEKQKAIDYYSQALPRLRSVGNLNDEAVTLNNLMFIYKSLNHQRLAISYGKQSVNAYQQARSYLQSLDTEAQKSYLKLAEHTYRGLAELLILQNRAAEAHQVLNAFKDQQLLDFDPTHSRQLKPLTPTTREAHFISGYQKISDALGALNVKVAELNLKISRRRPSDAEIKQLRQLETELKTASDEFSDFLKKAEVDFNQHLSQIDLVDNTDDTEKMQKTLRDLQANTRQKVVAIYTLQGEKNYGGLIVTRHKIIAFTYSINEAGFRQKVVDFWEQLGTIERHTDRPKFSEAEVQATGRDLYDIVFAPVAAKLKELNAKPDVLMWSLDGALRYIPVSALHDGKQYLAEHYRNVTFTRVDPANMLASVSKKWTGSAFYSSKRRVLLIDEKFVPFAKLRYAKQEVEMIFGTAQQNGIMRGEISPDEQFNIDSLRKILLQHRPLVHIASHFKLEPGNASLSFLLLGNGDPLTLADIQQEADDFFGEVELLTLSACETGVQKEREADGREIDGFAELAQRKGAKAVIASLWSVDDRSTSLLMTQFYQIREKKKLTKAKALQKAQLMLLKDSHYSHPYYWSPFILIGNWR